MVMWLNHIDVIPNYRNCLYIINQKYVEVKKDLERKNWNAHVRVCVCIYIFESV
jgi:hypothetical protein